MFRRGIGEQRDPLRLSRPIRHFTALCWMIGLGVVRGLMPSVGVDAAPIVGIAGP